MPCVERIYYFLLTNNDFYDVVLFQISSEMYPIFGEKLIITQKSRNRGNIDNAILDQTTWYQRLIYTAPRFQRIGFQTDARSLISLCMAL